MPVILPARSGYILWISGTSLSPNICFCSCGGAAANMVAGAEADVGVRVHPLDQREQSLTQHLLLLLRRGGGQHGRSQRLLAGDLDGGLGHGGGHHGLAPRSHHLPRRVPGRLGVGEAGLGPAGLLVHTWHGLGAGGSHTSWLGGPAGLGSDLSWGEEPLRLRHGWHEVSSHSHLLHTSHSLHPHAGHPLDVLAGQVGLPVLLPLGQSHVQRLGHDDTSVHLSHGLGGFLRRREANKSKALGASLLAHNLGGGDGSIGSKLLPETFIIDGIIQ